MIHIFFCLLLKCILVIRVCLVCRLAPFVLVKFDFECICWFVYPSVNFCRRENSCVAGRVAANLITGSLGVEPSATGTILPHCLLFGLYLYCIFPIYSVFVFLEFIQKRWKSIHCAKTIFEGSDLPSKSLFCCHLSPKLSCGVNQLGAELCDRIDTVLFPIFRFTSRNCQKSPIDCTLCWVSSKTS